MTEQEAQDFIDKVRGKKVRWSGWNKTRYFIPDGAWNDIAESFTGRDENGASSTWYIEGGFKNWSFVEEMITYKVGKGSRIDTPVFGGVMDEEIPPKTSCPHSNTTVTGFATQYRVCKDCKKDLGNV